MAFLSYSWLNNVSAEYDPNDTPPRAVLQARQITDMDDLCMMYQLYVLEQHYKKEVAHFYG
jgi:hypothetical protein